MQRKLWLGSTLVFSSSHPYCCPWVSRLGQVLGAGLAAVMAQGFLFPELSWMQTQLPQVHKDAANSVLLAFPHRAQGENVPHC